MLNGKRYTASSTNLYSRLSCYFRLEEGGLSGFSVIYMLKHGLTSFSLISIFCWYAWYGW
jgi:hypothetical protein